MDSLRHVFFCRERLKPIKTTRWRQQKMFGEWLGVVKSFELLSLSEVSVALIFWQVLRFPRVQSIVRRTDEQVRY